MQRAHELLASCLQAACRIKQAVQAGWSTTPSSALWKMAGIKSSSNRNATHVVSILIYPWLANLIIA
jgi:hypothetical protein